MTTNSKTSLRPEPRRRTPQRSRTLMRQAVSRPAPSLKRKIKVSSPSERSHAVAIMHPPANKELNNGRYRMLKQIKRSELISHFGPSINQPLKTRHAEPVLKIETANNIPSLTPSYSMPSEDPTIDELFERAIAQASSHLAEPPKLKRSKKLSRLLKRR